MCCDRLQKLGAFEVTNRQPEPTGKTRGEPGKRRRLAYSEQAGTATGSTPSSSIQRAAT